MKIVHLPPRVRRSQLFHNLNDDFLVPFFDAGTALHFETPTEILAQGQMPDGMYIVMSGHVSISTLDHAGNQCNLMRVNSGHVLGELEAITNQPCLATCTTEPDCRVMLWGKAQLDTALNNPTFVRNLIHLSYERMAIVNQVRAVEQSAGVDEKIVACLLRMSTEEDAKITQSQAYIAEAVGCSRQTVNRVLGLLRDAGSVSLRKSVITIEDRDALARRIFSGAA